MSGSPADIVAADPDASDAEKQGVYNTVRVINRTGKNLELSKIDIRNPEDGPGRPYSEAVVNSARLWSPRAGDVLLAGAEKSYGVTYWANGSNPKVYLTFKDSSKLNRAVYATESKLYGHSKQTIVYGNDFEVKEESSGPGKETVLSIKNHG
ncbi:hypothetical protein [Streptomyces sp. NPDC008121]|uniref:hypothetical protein n=1 Tax=Streptomyces sp. NPDC008121 TaxID=3364809 RepID=UPI0036E381EE